MPARSRVVREPRESIDAENGTLEVHRSWSKETNVLDVFMLSRRASDIFNSDCITCRENTQRIRAKPRLNR